MKIEIQIARPGAVNRSVGVSIGQTELNQVAFNIAFPEGRNRTGFYMRRHPKRPETSDVFVGPNNPLRSLKEPKKLAIRQHLLQMGFDIPSAPAVETAVPGRYRMAHSLIAVPVSDIVANLLRPCYSRSGLGVRRIFCFEDEPISSRTYWALCCFQGDQGNPNLKMLDVAFDVADDTVRSLDGRNLADERLQWAVSLVPLVREGKAVSASEIAHSDYDLRHIFGQAAVGEIESAYELWYNGWNDQVARLLSQKVECGTPFETYYHSAIGIDREGAVHIIQCDSTLPGLAQELAVKGLSCAGLLDSGGSCAIYDNWLGSYLNHSWYFREPRGAILAFQLKSLERIPEMTTGSWIQSRFS